MMTIPFAHGRLSQGADHDDMTMQKSLKYHHHQMISYSYDDMTMIHETPRTRTRVDTTLRVAARVLLTRSFKDNHNIVITIRNHSMMMIFSLKMDCHIVMEI